MSTPRPRVFISSLIQGYGDIRNAAAEAIKRANCQPVRAEDFPAANTSPRTACLDDVASSDAVCLILGKHYLSAGGALVPSGKSATHEEYEEAVRGRKPLFLFLDYRNDEPVDPDQQDFINQVTGYVSGHWRKSFRTLDELGSLLETALREAEPMMSSSGAAGGVTERLEAAFAAELPRGDHLVWLSIAWTTLRNEEVVDPLLLTDPAYECTMQEFAHLGASPLFSFKQSKDSVADPSRLRIVQGSADDWREASNAVVIDVYENGTLAIAADVAGSRRGSGLGNSLASMHSIDPAQVARRLEQAWGFAARWWHERDAWLRHANLDYNVGFRNIGMRRFASPPQQHGSSYRFTAPSRETPDPLWAYERPRRIGRPDLASPTAEIERIVRLFELRLSDQRR